MLGTSAPTVDPTPSNSTFLDSEFRYVLFPVIYSIIFILGFFANIYILFVLRCLRQTKAMREIHIYMTNLTIADLFFVCALPFWIGYYIRGGDWVYGRFMCQLTGSLFFINTYGTVLFLGAISLNRYWAVTKPLDAASSDHKCRGIVVCAAIWLFTVSATIPNWKTNSTHVDVENKNLTRCFEDYQNEDDYVKNNVAILHFLIIGMFFVVFFLVVVCNFLIAQALLTQKAPQAEVRSATVSPKKSRTMSSLGRRSRGVKRRALQMLFAVVAVFILCFLPHHIVQGPWTLTVLQIKDGWGHMDWGQETRQAINDAHQITLVLMSLNCILDPVVYYFATRKFKKLIVAHIKKCAKGEGCSSTVTTHVSPDSRDQI
ncbi:platelet-activating factor receptor-like [Melanotaenia boesemani]|uniref:platelet-activating factor receptor-like n=1 Tax=Melanotaenia boesemani TaxID=1250792 RepID=UPI001C043254|nr:platelet-activating factor receptor-like [Melanotaenia boesemani]